MDTTVRRQRGLVALLAAGGLLLGAVGCEDSDRVPPDESTITLAATPSTIVLSNGVQQTDIDVLATVYSSIGVPLPGQDVRFTTSSGELCLAPKVTPDDCRNGAGIPIETDDIGNAHVILQNARTNATITAKSGKAEGELQLQTATCEIQDIALSPSSLTFLGCAGEPDSSFQLSATVTDTDGDPCADILITFSSTVSDPPDEDVSFNFNPSPVRTNASGVATTTVQLGSDCTTDCRGADCNTSAQGIIATAGTIDSNEVDVTIDID